MNTANEIISSVKNLFTTSTSEAKGILKDPVVKQWNTVDIEQHSAILSDLHVSHQELSAAAQNYAKTAKKIIQDSTKWGNALSNLEADIKLNGLEEKEAHRQALKLLHDCNEVQSNRDTLIQYRKILLETAQLIQENLSLKTIFPLARANAEKRNKEKHNFEVGNRVFSTVTDLEEFKSPDCTLQSISAKAEIIAVKFNKLEIPELPELATVIINYQVNTCLAAVESIYSFIAFVRWKLKREIQKIDTLIEELEELKEEPFSQILSALSGMALKLQRAINEFRFNSHLLEEIKKTELLLENLQLFYSALRYAYLPHISSQFSQAYSPLTPHRLAEETAEKYFKGLKGILRLLRLVFASTSENGPVSEQALVEKISIALTTCPYYYCNAKGETEKLAQFIDKLINTYKKPYPYDDLFLLISNSIASYGSLIEKDLLRFKTDNRFAQDDETAPPPADEKVVVNLGRLIGKIEVAAQRLQAQQPQKE